ncbi:inner centromere protein [Galendromus occidentalis]|uniref:Inner centromere protein n=1 Tax=Galendromus occidentalis TaxID=34638 RepID=A0AAJ7SEE5_9ACAR|nr:inner centromere protein [Galendromus occidentalis]
MVSSKRNLTARGKFIFSRALEKLDNRPPTVQELPTYEMCDATVYRKTVSDLVVEQMRTMGYKVVPPPQWETELEALRDIVNRFKHNPVSQAAFNRSIKQARDLLDQLKSGVDKEKSDEEWEDVDTSVSSIRSVSSCKGAARKSVMLNAKKSLKQMMQESAKKSTKLDRSKSTRTLKNTSANDTQTSKGDKKPRALKRQASSVVASEAKKDKKNSTHEMDKTEFARSQNHRVQMVKERKEIKDKERNDQIRAKLQQKQQTLKEKEKKDSENRQDLDAEDFGDESENEQGRAGSAFRPGNGCQEGIPLDDLRHGGLAKQAMFQSILAAGEDAQNVTKINSTFLPGVTSKPDFDASLAMNRKEDTFTVDAVPNATYVSKPGFVLSPSRMNQLKEAGNSEGFVDSFNETFRDYGLEDLCSDSDNTDDESAPTKPVPKWAELKTSRFKNKVKEQRMLGQDIEKYGLLEIYVPPFVDLEMIFERKSKRFDRHNASSGLWNDTQDFIRQ